MTPKATSQTPPRPFRTVSPRHSVNKVRRRGPPLGSWCGGRGLPFILAPRGGARLFFDGRGGLLRSLRSRRRRRAGCRGGPRQVVAEVQEESLPRRPKPPWG